MITLIYSVLFLGFSIVAINTLTKKSTLLLLESEINACANRAKDISLLGAHVLDSSMTKTEYVKLVQNTIEGTNNENTFLSVIDWSGKIICYPDITEVGNVNDRKNSMVANLKNKITAAEIYQFIRSNKSLNAVEHDSEIIDLNPIPNSDLIIATHLNLNRTQERITDFKNGFVFILVILGLSILVILLSITRYINSHYLEAIEKHSLRLEDGMLNLSKLNSSLESYQKNIALQKEAQALEEIEAIEKEDESEIKEFPKKRLLTYIRNELMPISIEDISYIYLENTITYIVRKDGKRFTANDSLDQIYATLDQKLFFRANRQIIVSIYAIDKIIKFGNSALKIETKPASEIDIVIGKNKASSFKQWLDL
ncbi:MAG: LytTR family transcriptional regulator DNA-binding domain-containing protein [bacterium]